MSQRSNTYTHVSSSFLPNNRFLYVENAQSYYMMTNSYRKHLHIYLLSANWMLNNREWERTGKINEAKRQKWLESWKLKMNENSFEHIISILHTRKWWLFEYKKSSPGSVGCSRLVGLFVCEWVMDVMSIDLNILCRLSSQLRGNGLLLK